MKWELSVGGVDIAVQPLTAYTHSPLCPEEEQIAHTYRSHDAALRFRAARQNAHTLLERVTGSYGAPILRADSGAPIFPSGISGSISHTTSHSAVAIDPRPETVSLGIDIERLDRQIVEAISARILTVFEQNALPTEKEERAHQILRAFSIKEAVYKAYAPRGATTLGFQDIELIFTAHTPEVAVRQMGRAITDINASQRIKPRLMSISEPTQGLVLSLALLTQATYS